MRVRLVIFAAIAAAAAPAASAANWGAIDCAKAATADERAICSSTELVQLDAQMSTEFGLLKGFLAMGGRGALQDGQKDWLAVRHTCAADAACLRKAYDDRIRVLEEGFQRIRSFGPF